MARKRKTTMPKYDDGEMSNLALLTLDRAHELLLRDDSYRSAVHKSWESWDSSTTNRLAAALGQGRLEYDSGEPLGMLMHYVARISAGAYPDPDIARHIAQCFRRYLSQRPKERITLDSAFGLLASPNAWAVSAFEKRLFRERWILEMNVYVYYHGETRKKAAIRVHDHLAALGKRLSVSAIIRDFRQYERHLKESGVNDDFFKGRMQCAS